MNETALDDERPQPPHSPREVDDRTARVLETVAAGPLPGFLHTRRWFGAKGREIARVRPLDHAELVPASPGRPAYVLAIFDVAYRDGEREASDVYAIPLVIGTGGSGGADSVIGEIRIDDASVTIGDALADERFARALLAAIARNSVIETAQGGALVGKAATHFAGVIGGGAIEDLPARVLRAEQSNTSLVFAAGGNDRVIMKCLRRLAEGVGLEVEIGAHLGRVGFRGTPAMLGDLSYLPRAHAQQAGPMTLAIAQQFVANAGDGWAHAVSDVRVRLESHYRSSRPSREPYDVAIRSLGRLTGEMHLALAADRRSPELAPEPLTEDDRNGLAIAAATRLVELVAYVERSASAWSDELRVVARSVIEHAPLFAERLRKARLPAGLVKTRIHGDFHLGQVLRIHDEASVGWTIVDFEGEPARPLAERRAKSSPLKDVAGMLRSFDYAAFAGIRDVLQDERDATRRGEIEADAARWRESARAAFLDGWLSVSTRAELSMVPTDATARAEALELFELEKALYELTYEIENRPDWVGIPLRGIGRLIERRR